MRDEGRINQIETEKAGLQVGRIEFAPAFPFPVSREARQAKEDGLHGAELVTRERVTVEEGVTVLDYFARAALPQIITILEAERHGEDDADVTSQAAAYAYRYAEAMVAEKAKRESRS